MDYNHGAHTPISTNLQISMLVQLVCNVHVTYVSMLQHTLSILHPAPVCVLLNLHMWEPPLRAASIDLWRALGLVQRCFAVSFATSPFPHLLDSVALLQIAKLQWSVPSGETKCVFKCKNITSRNKTC